jgi:hypothetical protein
MPSFGHGHLVLVHPLPEDFTLLRAQQVQRADDAPHVRGAHLRVLRRRAKVNARRVPPDERTWACDVGG